MTFLEAVRTARQLDQKLSFPRVSQVVVVATYRELENGDIVSSPDGDRLSCSYVDPICSLMDYVRRERGISFHVFNSSKAINTLGLALQTDEHTVNILVPRDASFCLKRFAIVKEILHFLKPGLSSSEFSGKALFSLIEQASSCFSDEISTLVRELPPEVFCYLVAVEIFLLWSIRIQQIKIARDHRHSDLVVAEMFRVPLIVIQEFFAKEGIHALMSRKVNYDIDV